MKRNKADKRVTALFLIKRSLHKQSDISLELILNCSLVELYSRKEKELTESQFVDYVNHRALEFFQELQLFTKKGENND